MLTKAGVEITPVNSGIRVRRNGHGIEPVDVRTEPFPAFPTDLQAQFMGLMTKAKGTSHITETIFEKPLHACAGAGAPRCKNFRSRSARLRPLKVSKSSRWRRSWRPTCVSSSRCGDCGSCSRRRDQISRIYHLDRGFEHLEEKLSACGAEIERISG